MGLAESLLFLLPTCHQLQRVAWPLPHLMSEYLWVLIACIGEMGLQRNPRDGSILRIVSLNRLHWRDGAAATGKIWQTGTDGVLIACIGEMGLQRGKEGRKAGRKRVLIACIGEMGLQHDKPSTWVLRKTS